MAVFLCQKGGDCMERLEKRFKGPARRPAAPAVDTSALSTRTQEVVYQIAQYRESMGLAPLPSLEPYRRGGLRRF